MQFDLFPPGDVVRIEPSPVARLRMDDGLAHEREVFAELGRLHPDAVVIDATRSRIEREAATASALGRAFRVRRNDLRLLVGCGAAGAIAAAFNAPLTGAFYAFELVIGTYSLATLAPVVMSAICAVSVMRVVMVRVSSSGRRRAVAGW